MSAPLAPGLHTQAVLASDPAGADENSGHVVHAALPVELLNVSTSHATHGPPAGPVVPVVQAQALSASLPRGDQAFPGHPEHAGAPAAEYESGTQYLQSPLVVDPLNLPAAHSTHRSFAGPDISYPGSHAQSDGELPAAGM